MGCENGSSTSGASGKTRFISRRNDGSMPKSSSTQRNPPVVRYRRMFSTSCRAEHTHTLQHTHCSHRHRARALNHPRHCSRSHYQPTRTTPRPQLPSTPAAARFQHYALHALFLVHLLSSCFRASGLPVLPPPPPPLPPSPLTLY